MMGIIVNPGGGGTTLPSQTGNNGKFLKTDGSALSWDPASLTVYDATGTLADGASITIEHPSDPDKKRIPFFRKLDSIFGTYALLNFEGANDSTTFADSGPLANSVTRDGSAVIKTAEYKFGSSSGLFLPGSGDSVHVPSVSLSGDFTLGAWVRFTTLAAYNTLFRQPNPGIFVGLKSDATGIRWGRTDVAEYGNAAFSWSTNTWYHFLLTRASNTVRVFVNGTQVGSDVTNSNNYAEVMYVGGGGGFAVNGYMDNAYILNGYALHTANFTTPTTPFTDPGYVQKPMTIGTASTGVINCIFADGSNLNSDTKTTFTNKTGSSVKYICGVNL
jgi:hypothetical protein